MDIQVLRLTSTCTRYIRERCPDSMSSVFVPCRFFFFSSLSPIRIIRDPREEQRGRERKRAEDWNKGNGQRGVIVEKGITARHCPALIPPFYYHLTPFNGSPHFPSSSAHTICSQPPSSDSVKSVIQPGLSRWGGRVLGGVTSMVVLGGVRPFSDPNFIYSPQLDSGGPLC